MTTTQNNDELTSTASSSASITDEQITSKEYADATTFTSENTTDAEPFDEDVDSEDSLTFSNGVIEKIVALAVRDVDGVLGMRGGWVNRVYETFGAVSPTRGVTVEVTPDNAVRVNIAVLIEYGAYAPQIFEDVKKVVVKQITGMTGLEVAGVNLRIEDVLTADEFEAGKREDAAKAASDFDESAENPED
ncbi:Asp23/Gls24 family envelope stress response protein [Atopobium fossor]|uniref:Asp23/Gls24 family envelope stress response protein n=1 Tax=Atopobium fossor TaxID=39487 RepID=UPI00041E2FE1|nr:Asp23/Gls24 family envelope stress response protein [Atopobium fossor]